MEFVFVKHNYLDPWRQKNFVLNRYYFDNSITDLVGWNKYVWLSSDIGQFFVKFAKAVLDER